MYGATTMKVPDDGDKTVLWLIMLIYAAIIACLLIALYTGRKPTLRTYEMFCWFLTGWADEDELMTHIEKLKKQTTA